jgi:hypothetical protein
MRVSAFDRNQWPLTTGFRTVTPKQFRMRDSDGLHIIRRDDCVVELDCTKISIPPMDVFLISRG